jgi:hypothetical protein
MSVSGAVLADFHQCPSISSGFDDVLNRVHYVTARIIGSAVLANIGRDVSQNNYHVVPVNSYRSRTGRRLTMLTYNAFDFLHLSSNAGPIQRTGSDS